MAGTHCFRYHPADFDSAASGKEPGGERSGAGKCRRHGRKGAWSRFTCRVAAIGPSSGAIVAAEKARKQGGSEAQDCAPRSPGNPDRTTTAIRLLRQHDVEQHLVAADLRTWIGWRARRDSNSRPSDSKSDALSS